MAQITVAFSEVAVNGVDDGYPYLGLEGITAPGDVSVVYTNTSSAFVINSYIWKSGLYLGDFFSFSAVDSFTYNGADPYPSGAVSSIALTDFYSNAFWTITGLGSLNLTAEQIVENPALAFSGDDTITVTNSLSPTFIYAGDGNDTVIGGTNTDYIYLQRGNGLADGGAGTDWGEADFSDRTAPVVYSHNDIEATVYVGGVASVEFRNIEHINITGGSGYDVIVGGDSEDIISLGLGGGDVDGRGGFDKVAIDFSDATGNANFVFDPSMAIATVAGATYAVVRNVESVDLTGGAGADHFVGSPSNDRFDGGPGDDYIDGAGGTDELHFANDGPGAVDLKILGPQDTGYGHDTILNIETVVGGDSGDTFYGDDLVNTLYGGAGDDILAGRGGHDYLYGGAGSDTLDGGDGDDYINASADGTLFGSFDPNAGTNAISGGAGDDLIFGDNGNDFIDGGDGHDTIYGLGGANVIHGGNDFDQISGGPDADILYGDAGDDQIYGDAGGDRIYGGDGNDGLGAGGGPFDSTINFDAYLDGGAGDDTLAGNWGNDILVGGPGRDSMEGGFGFDIADYSSAPSGVVVSRNIPDDYIGDSSWQDTQGAGVDRLLSIEGVIGSAYNDDLTASDFSGSSLWGGDGNDVLHAGASADMLDGAGGVDTADYSTSGAGVAINLADATASGGGAQGDTLINIENLVGSAFADTLTGDANSNVLAGLAGADTLTGNAGDDVLTGGLGVDTASYASASTSDSWHRNPDGTWTITTASEGTDTLTSVEHAHFADRDLYLDPAQQTFSGDGTSDILWRRSDGFLATWSMNGAAHTGSAIVGGVGNEWSIAGTGDFNGDGRADILWQRNDGLMAIWEMNGASQLASGVIGSVGTAWHVAGVGDYNGDGMDDIFWRNDSGLLAVWTMHGLTVASTGVTGSVGGEWGII